jgi:hypothetical protein
MMRLDTGARIIMFWEPSPQVKTVITTTQLLGNPQRTRTEIMANQTPHNHWNTPVTGTV